MRTTPYHKLPLTITLRGILPAMLLGSLPLAWADPPALCPTSGATTGSTTSTDVTSGGLTGTPVTPVTVASPAVADLQAQIQTVRQSEQTAQWQLSQALHLGTATPADVVAAATAIRQIQAQRQGLEGQVKQLLAQQSATALGSGALAVSGGTGALGGPLNSSGPSTVSASSAAALAALPAAQQTALAARQSLAQQITALQQQGALDGPTLASVVSQWQTNNAAVLAQGDQAAAAASAANRPKVLARLLASQGQAAPAANANLPPNMQALLQARQAAAQELEIIVLQSGSLSPTDYQAALAQWQAAHAPALAQLTTAAEAETKALGVAAASARVSTVPALPGGP
jgi:hypothetical protein